MLKSLELFGFKSFADKTVVEFSSGITGVVGPNGSGKSNVVDAIKWILGDQSAKSLRGREMTDVIFNGSSSRKANAFAEATLDFDNTSGFLPITHDEVSVGRRLWRNGDSEYLINRNVVRLRDVRDLFMGTGAGATAYCIIEQGRVDQILQANATSRRLVFEEAAGISRYRSRRAEATRKLERVEQNLLRLNDIVEEVEAQLNSLRTQAARATKYRQVTAELRELWVGLAADDYRCLLGQAERIEADCNGIAEQLEHLRQRQQFLTAQLADFDSSIHDVDGQLRSAEREGSHVREQLAAHDATIRHESARLSEIDNDLTRLRKQRLVMARRSTDAARELQEACEIHETCAADRERTRQELREQEAQVGHVAERLRNAGDRLQADRDELEACIENAISADRETDSVQSRIESLDQSRESASERLDDYQRRIESDRRQCGELQQRVTEAQADADTAEREVRTVQETRKGLLREQERMRQSLAELRERRSGWQARRSVLEDLESRREGMGIGVRDLLDRGATASAAPWDTIVGSVADLLEVDIEDAALVELALGERSQLIVLTRLRPLIDYLNSGRCSVSERAGCVALEDIRISSNSGGPPAGAERSISSRKRRPELSGQAGIIRRADGLTHVDARFEGLAEFLLGDTWVVETLDDALRLQRENGALCRFVTMQGELLESDGTVYFGVVRGESAVVSCRSELRRLKKDLHVIEQQIQDQEIRIAGLDSGISDCTGELENAQRDLRHRTDMLTNVRSEMLDRRRQLTRLEEEVLEVREDAGGIDVEQQELSDALSQARMAHARAQESVQILRHTTEQNEREIARGGHRLRLLERRCTEQQVELTRQEERAGNSRERFERQTNELEQREQQRLEAERRLTAAVFQRRGIVLNILNARGVSSELALEEERLSALLGRQIGEKSSAHRLRAGVNDEQTQLRAHRNDLTERQHKLLLDSRELRHQMETLAERIAEEFQLDLGSVVRDGASAVRLWLEAESAASKRTIAADASASLTPFPDDAADAGDATSQPAIDAGEHESDRHRTRRATAAFDDTAAHERYQEIRGEVEERVEKLRRRLKNIGSVSSESIEDLDELERRFGHLNSQLQDLVEAKKALEEIIRRIDSESRRLFADTFHSIRGHFRELFRKLFGGGDGDVILEDPNDMLDCGIDVVARPPGKELRSISLLSGGEKTMTAVALLMSIFRSRPSPFCILDEVDAALDDANLDRFVGVLQEFQESTQFIMITHRKPTMAVADVLYGVTMEESGVSKRLSVRFEDVNENGEFSGGMDPDANSRAA